MSKEQAEEFFEAAAKDEASDADLAAVSGGLSLGDHASLRPDIGLDLTEAITQMRSSASSGQSVARTELTPILGGVGDLLDDFGF